MNAWICSLSPSRYAEANQGCPPLQPKVRLMARHTRHLLRGVMSHHGMIQTANQANNPALVYWG